jgi:Transposase DDE domain group 1
MANFRNWFRACKSRIERRLDKRIDTLPFEPVFSASNIHYDVSDRVSAISAGGIGAFHLLARKVGLIEGIDANLHLLKLHMPYHESDHVLNIAYNALCDGTCLEDIELRRNDENYLDALGAERIADPTTAGDFCRRFDSGTIGVLQDVINESRLRVWARQPHAFFDRATIDMDGSLVPSTGQCKEGMDFDYKKSFGYHPLVLTLAETGELLRIINRSGNRPSHEGAALEVDRILLLCARAGFRKIVLRGDTDFSQTQRLDGWDQNPMIRFFFGYDCVPKLVEIADNLAKTAWRPLQRRSRDPIKTQPRPRPENVKERMVKKHKYENLRLISEDVAELEYRPNACRKTYRMVVVRKNLSLENGQQELFPNERYHFYITNEREASAEEVVHEALDRCNQENVISQLKNGTRSLHAPVDNLESNWAYMVMTSLAWTMKAWWALMLPAKPGRKYQRHRDDKQRVLKMEFKTFLNAFMLLPCQIVRTGRKLVYRLLCWNPHLPILFRLINALRC